MANTQDIRRRIRSIRNTAQITKAMQMVAASKMRKAQQHALAGRPARIRAKMNQLQDQELIRELYKAGQAGVRISLNVRGLCCLRPGVDGLSERIRVRSIVGSYLEHSRIFRFGSDARGPRYWIGSADLMPRNLASRVECVAPVTDPELAARLEEILVVNLSDDLLAWELSADGWTKVPTTTGIDAHARLQELAEARAFGTDRG